MRLATARNARLSATVADTPRPLKSVTSVRQLQRCGRFLPFIGLIEPMNSCVQFALLALGIISRRSNNLVAVSGITDVVVRAVCFATVPFGSTRTFATID
jgi:hypothetical protein